MTVPWEAQTILVAGDVMLDEYLDGDVVRISPEAPVPILNVKQQFSVPGGAANAACGVQALGAKTQLFSVVGVDDTSLELRRLLKQCSVKANFVLASRPTTRKTRIISNGHQLCRVDNELIGPLSSGEEQELKNIISASLKGNSAILLSDYGKGVLSTDLIQFILESASEQDIPVVVDPKGKSFEKYAGATLITPNYKEACEALGKDISEGLSGADLGTQLLDLYAFKYVLVTLGAEGMVLVQRGVKPLHLAAVAHEVYDVSGAGDTVAAVMSLGLGARLKIEEAMWLANVAAGLAVTKPGTQTVSREELVREVKRQRNVFNRVKNFFSGL